eukprot:1372083-Alexandrium_andersonii.AAC.1
MSELVNVASGLAARVPEADLVIAGFSCVGLSPLNTASSLNCDTLADYSTKSVADSDYKPTSTGATFRGILEYLRSKRPAWTMLENSSRLASSKGSNMQTVHAAYDSLGYDMVSHRVDAASFGTPQRRTRVYLWGADRACAGCDFGGLGGTLQQLRSPANVDLATYLKQSAPPPSFPHSEQVAQPALAGKRFGKAGVEGVARPAKKGRSSAVGWPTMHKKVCDDNGIPFHEPEEPTPSLAKVDPAFFSLGARERSLIDIKGRLIPDSGSGAQHVLDVSQNLDRVPLGAGISPTITP